MNQEFQSQTQETRKRRETSETYSRDIKILRRQWHPTPVILPGKSYGWRSLVGCSSWGCWELDMTQWLHFHFSLSCTGEGNGNPLQYSCLENPRDREAWWAAIYVALSRTWLKRLSSSSSSGMDAGIDNKKMKQNRIQTTDPQTLSWLKSLFRSFH